MAALIAEAVYSRYNHVEDHQDHKQLVTSPDSFLTSIVLFVTSVKNSLTSL